MCFMYLVTIIQILLIDRMPSWWVITEPTLVSNFIYEQYFEFFIQLLQLLLKKLPGICCIKVKFVKLNE